MRFQGKLSHWNDAKGIGSITWNGGSGDKVAVHISVFTNRSKRPAEGDIVTYEVEKDKNGKFRAINVSFPSSQLIGVPERTKPSSGVFVGVVLVFFAAYLLFSTFTGKVQALALWVYAVASIIAFVAYCMDKAAAGRGRWRTQERTLHMLSLCCGWPGAFLAQRTIRHKTVKESFQDVFKATVVVNVAGFCIYSSPAASHLVLSFFG
jgi:uncharacterized membrane protein YsdA (DUF1294 family)/cold shock CspA family protein